MNKKPLLFAGIAVIVLLLGSFMVFFYEKESPEADLSAPAEQERPEKVENYSQAVKDILQKQQSNYSSELSEDALENLITTTQLSLEQLVIDSSDQAMHLSLILELSQAKKALEKESKDQADQLMQAFFEKHLP